MDPKIQEKVWDPKIESEIRKKWENSKLYEFQAEDGIRARSPSRGLGDVYKRQR